MTVQSTAIVDGHHHFWDLGVLPYPWLRPEAPPRPFGDHTAIKRNFLPEDYRRATAGLDIVASVHVEAAPGADDPAAETRWLEGMARSGLPTASVAHVDLRAPDLERQLDGLAAFSILRGVRAGLAWRANSPWHFASGPGLSREPAFRRGVSLLAGHALSLDLVVLPEQLTEVADLARDHPETPVIIDHLATAEFTSPELRDIWWRGIAEVARVPNIAIKLSGMWTLSRRWELAVLRDPVRHVVASFGPGRCLWGSNLPIEGLMCGAVEQVETLETILGDLAPDEIANVFSGTARRLYRLPAPAQCPPDITG